VCASGLPHVQSGRGIADCRDGADSASTSSPLAGLVVTSGLLGDDVHPVVGVDESDEAHQCAELFIVVVLGRVRPGFVRDAAAIREPRSLFRELQSGLFGLGEDGRLSPGGDR
jgi:hypothetical protein